MVICRTNASLISELVRGVENNFKISILGGADSLVSLLKGVERLQQGAASDYPDLIGYTSWQEVIDDSRTPEGASTLPFVPMVEMYGVKKLLQVLNVSNTQSGNADLTISTAHRTKGCEWERVELSDDFLVSRMSENGVPLVPHDEEFRIAYVALTRARSEIYVPPELLDYLRTMHRLGDRDTPPKKSRNDFTKGSPEPNGLFARIMAILKA